MDRPHMLRKAKTQAEFRCSHLASDDEDDGDDYEGKDRVRLAWVTEQAKRKANQLEHALEHNDDLLHRIESLERDNKKLVSNEQYLLHELEQRRTPRTGHESGSTGDTSEGELARELEMAIRDRDDALEARDAAIHERDECLHERDRVLRANEVTISSLRAKLMHTQQHCAQLHATSEELRLFGEAKKRENENLYLQIEELEEIVTSQRQNKQSVGAWFSCASDRKAMRSRNVGGDDSLAMQIKVVDEYGDAEHWSGSECSQRRRRSTSIGGRSVSPAERSRSNSATSNRLQQLQRDYQQTFEKQQQQLEEAMKHKQLIEAEKDRELHKLHKQLKALQTRPRVESEDDTGAFAGVLSVLDRVRELTLEATDAVVLNLAGVADESDGDTPARSSQSPPGRSSKAANDSTPHRHFCNRMTHSDELQTLRDRLQKRRSRRVKRVEGEAARRSHIGSDRSPALPEL
mmetsp:Transcript_63676/g.179226  ORF Transcript_63676/g.179226 Transcript_63676/m.179226 type:complete len:462 (-) Transcript_63676:130-1515(-)